jgi:uncharacterized protein (TIGR00270 family)
MAECELCGGRASRKAKIEGVMMDVCGRCAGLGEEIVKPKISVVKREIRPPEEFETSVRSDLGKLVKGRREKLRLTQEELAKRLSLNVSLITRIENGWTPPLAIVEKLERFFRTELKDTAETTKTKAQARNKPLTLGDVAEIRE